MVSANQDKVKGTMTYNRGNDGAFRHSIYRKTLSDIRTFGQKMPAETLELLAREVLNRLAYQVDEKVLPGPGWATLCLCNDGQHAVLGNFFNGQIGKFDLSSGDMIVSAETDVERSVAGIAQF